MGMRTVWRPMLEANAKATQPTMLQVQSQPVGSGEGETVGNTSSKDETRPLRIPREAVTAAFAETQSQTDDIITKAGFAGYWDHVHPAQEQLCIALIVEALIKLRCDVARTKEGQKLRRVTPAPAAQKQQLDFCYGMLTDAGLIAQEGDDYIRTDKPMPKIRGQDALEDILGKHPTYESLNKLVYFAGKNLANIHGGRDDAVRAIFGSQEARGYLEDIYGQSHPSKAFHMLLQDFTTRFLERLAATGTSADGQFRILEIGAGTGGTTKWLAPLLQKQAANKLYTFTDVGSGFVGQAARRFGPEYDFMTFRTLDMEAEPPQDLEWSQNMVLAVNAVHATKDMTASLRNVRRMLCPGGFALIMEVSARLCWADFVFGLFEGWWCFQDGRTHATADTDVWEKAFLDSGFATVHWTQGNMVDSGLQKVFLATVA